MQDATFDAQSSPVCPTGATLNVDLRQAEPSDFARLRAFYLLNKSLALPVPPVKTLGDAMNEGRLLVVEADRQSPILAAAAIFGYSPLGWKTYVGELSGACVTGALNGYRPLGVQRILLAARVLGHVALNNQRSIGNVVAAGFVRLVDRPDWMVYDEHDWHGSPVGTDWFYFVATDQTARQAYADLDSVGAFTGTVRLSRVSRSTGQTESLNIQCHLGELRVAQRDLANICAGAPAGLSPPPPELLR